jgi:hypothetical protein
LPELLDEEEYDQPDPEEDVEIDTLVEKYSELRAILFNEIRRSDIYKAKYVWHVIQ